MQRLTLSLLTTGLLLSGVVQAQTSPTLEETILKQDAVLFAAFNNCDSDTWRRYLDDDVEFYQDNDDPTFSRADLEPSFLDRCKDGKRANLLREFVPEGHDVHPIQGVGAVQFGTHRFLLRQDDGSLTEVARPRFVHLWENNDGQWRVIRVISYDH